jgi:hypothetical protein
MFRFASECVSNRVVMRDLERNERTCGCFGFPNLGGSTSSRTVETFE